MRHWYTAVSKYVYNCISVFDLVGLSDSQSIQQADYIVPVEIDHHWHNFYVLKRPGVDDFLREMGLIYEVVVFTASLSVVRISPNFHITSGILTRFRCLQYADPVLDKLDVGRAVTHRLFRESCYNHKGNYVKVRLRACLLSPNSTDIVYPGSLTARKANRRYYHPRQLSCFIHIPP